MSAAAKSKRHIVPSACRGREDMRKQGLAMSMEAAASLLLVFAALYCLALFWQKPGGEADFFLCSDAAQALLKSSSFSDSVLLQERAGQAAALSGLCISASGWASCPYAGQERIAFTFPAWQGGEVQNATVSCWRQ
jgi:hypothetical protein